MMYYMNQHTSRDDRQQSWVGNAAHDTLHFQVDGEQLASNSNMQQFQREVYPLHLRLTQGFASSSFVYSGQSNMIDGRRGALSVGAVCLDGHVEVSAGDLKDQFPFSKGSVSPLPYDHLHFSHNCLSCGSADHDSFSSNKMCAFFRGSAGHDICHSPPSIINEWGRSYPRDPLINNCQAEPDLNS
eukprot:1112873-Karenia_brevis.AAC.1